MVSKPLFAPELPLKRMYLYEAGKTWWTSGQVSVSDSARLELAGNHTVRGGDYRYAPILSNLKIKLHRPDQVSHTKN